MLKEISINKDISIAKTLTSDFYHSDYYFGIFTIYCVKLKHTATCCIRYSRYTWVPLAIICPIYLYVPYSWAYERYSSCHGYVPWPYRDAYL